MTASAASVYFPVYALVAYPLVSCSINDIHEDSACYLVGKYQGDAPAPVHYLFLCHFFVNPLVTELPTKI